MRALALSVGGAKLHYHVGFLDILLRQGSKYDLVAGSSAGAWAAAMLAQYPVGEEQQAADEMVRASLGVSTRAVFRRWLPFGLLQAPWKPSVYNSREMVRTAREILSAERIRRSGRMLRIPAVRWSDMKARVFTEKDDAIVEAVAASSSVPGVFTPVKIEGEWYVDGGVRSTTPLSTVVRDGALEVDVVLTSAAGVERVKGAPRRAFDVTKRALSAMWDELLEEDLSIALERNALAAHQIGSWRRVEVRVYRPETDIETGSLDFSPENAEALRKRGRADARRLLGIG